LVLAKIFVLTIPTGIRFEPNLGTQGFDGGLNSAILRYDGADEEDPTTEETDATAALAETDLIPLDNPGAVRAFLPF
jgi:iron transport multicopper oxidase